MTLVMSSISLEICTAGGTTSTENWELETHSLARDLLRLEFSIAPRTTYGAKPSSTVTPSLSGSSITWMSPVLRNLRLAVRSTKHCLTIPSTILWTILNKWNQLTQGTKDKPRVTTTYLIAQGLLLIRRDTRKGKLRFRPRRRHLKILGRLHKTTGKMLWGTRHHLAWVPKS